MPENFLPFWGGAAKQQMGYCTHFKILNMTMILVSRRY